MIMIWMQTDLDTTILVLDTASNQKMNFQPAMVVGLDVVHILNRSTLSSRVAVMDEDKTAAVQSE